MALTIEKALSELPILSSAEVVAGRQGLGNIIRWVHIVDIPELSPWVREHDLLMTTAYAIKDLPEGQNRLISTLVEHHMAGIIIAIGRYIQEIPAEFIADADRYDFPVIQLPWDVPFVEVTRAIHEWILRQQMVMTEQSFEIHKVLTQLVIDGGDLPQLAKSLASLINRSVTIEDPSLRMLAYYTFDPPDELRKISIELKKTPDRAIGILQKMGIFEFPSTTPQVHFVAPIPEIGMVFERILAPIRVGGQLFGYIWVISGGTPLSQLDFEAIERAASIAALIMSREQAIFEAEQRGRAKIFESLMDPDAATNFYEIAETMRRLGLHGDYQIITLEDKSEKKRSLRALIRFAEDQFQAAPYDGTVIEWGNRVVLLVTAQGLCDGMAIANRMVEKGEDIGFCLFAGLSRRTNQATGVRKCYQEAVDALQIGYLLGEQGKRIWAYDHMGYLIWLASLPPEMKELNYFEAIVQKIQDYDRQRKSDLLRTLEVFLDTLANMQQTAESLYIHRNTLRQRLNRIQDLWDLDLNDTHVLINLYLVIKARKISNQLYVQSAQ